jgi:arginine/serine-rich splicing factor 4/5/6
MSRRLYLGRLPPDTRSEDVSKFFDGYGRIVDVRVMTGFGFVEFESPKDAEDALHNFNGKAFMGANIVVEFAKETRPRREPYEDRGPRTRRPTGVRLIVSGISRDTSWQVRIFLYFHTGPLAYHLCPLAYMEHRHKDKAGVPSHS